MLLAIDPGMGSPGVALFDREGRLCTASAQPCPEHADLPAGRRWFAVADTIALWARAAASRHSGGVYNVDRVVFEKPQWYPRERSEVDPNNLVGIAGVAANVTGMLRPIDIMSPTPAEWVGQCPKVCPTCEGRKTEKRTDGKKGRGKKVVICPDCNSSAWGTPRGRRIASRLRPEELARCPDQNDAIDAVGLGLWALGRFTPISVFSNGNDGR